MDVSEYWHLRVFVKAGSKAGITVLDQSRDWIEKRLLEPRRTGTPITIKGREVTWAEIASVSINVSDVPSSQLIEKQKALDAHSGVGRPIRAYAPIAAASAKDVTDELIDSPVGSGASAKHESSHQVSGTRPDPRKVMVVHGRDDEARRAMFDFLRALGLAPQEWSVLVAETGSGAPYIGEVLKGAFEIATAVVVLFTPDDEAYLREMFQGPHEPPEEKEPTPQARPNVLFEAGMALGVRPMHTILVELGKLRPFSDIYGRHVIRLDHTEKPLREIAARLKTAGCAVDESGSDWASTVFPRRDAAQTGKRPQRSSSSPAGELDFKLAVSEGEPITRIDLRKETLHDFLLKQRQTLLRSLPDDDTTRDLLDVTTVKRDYRLPETYRAEVDRYLGELATVLPDVLRERAVLHDIGRLIFVVTNDQEHSWRKLRLELSVAEGPTAISFRPEKEHDRHKLTDPPRLYGAHSDRYEFSDVLVDSIMREIEPAWVPAVSTSDGRLRVRFQDVDVRAEGQHYLPPIWLLADNSTPSTIQIDWEATADNATKRLKGTIEVAIPDQYVSPERLLETPPDLTDDD